MTMAMEPTDNDVLSGRGAWFNQHPGNEQFRRILAEKKVSEPQLYPRLSIDAVCRTNVRVSSFKDCLHGRHQETKDGHIQGYR